MIASPYDPPVAVVEGLDRLAVRDHAEKARGESDLAPSSVDWDAIDARIQSSLSTLAERVLRLRPEIPSCSGAVRARAIALFSYRIFYPPGGDQADPIVVGLTFGMTGTNIRIRGDISLEESGRILFEEDMGIVLPSPRHQDVIAIAGTLADRLSDQIGVVIEALRPEPELEK